ncbi:hypothetical protein AJ88_31550 [Mesorhizobium amorphae CCBAU 01583]|nr:hypothetical protein AJ88_31550 [Mesorhizobium amorphae CCBAU 01583]
MAKSCSDQALRQSPSSFGANVTAYHFYRRPPLWRDLPQGTKYTRYSAADDQNADKIGSRFQKLSHHSIGLTCFLVGGAAFLYR